MRKNYRICVMTSDHRLKVKQYPSCKKIYGGSFIRNFYDTAKSETDKAIGEADRYSVRKRLENYINKKSVQNPKISAVNKKKKTNGKCKRQGIIEQIDS